MSKKMSEITRQEYYAARAELAEQEYGKQAPTETRCAWFLICCELGTEDGCNGCKYKRLR